jgi:hypothetical protein
MGFRVVLRHLLRQEFNFVAWRHRREQGFPGPDRIRVSRRMAVPTEACGRMLTILNSRKIAPRYRRIIQTDLELGKRLSAEKSNLAYDSMPAATRAGADTCYRLLKHSNHHVNVTIWLPAAELFT